MPCWFFTFGFIDRLQSGGLLFAAVAGMLNIHKSDRDNRKNPKAIKTEKTCWLLTGNRNWIIFIHFSQPEHWKHKISICIYTNFLNVSKNWNCASRLVKMYRLCAQYDEHHITRRPGESCWIREILALFFHFYGFYFNKLNQLHNWSV